MLIMIMLCRTFKFYFCSVNLFWALYILGHADIKYKLKSRVANVDTNGEDCSRKPSIKKDSSWIDDIKYLAKKYDMCKIFGFCSVNAVF